MCRLFAVGSDYRVSGNGLSRGTSERPVGHLYGVACGMQCGWSGARICR